MRPRPHPICLALAILLAGCSTASRVLPSKDSLPFVYRIDVQQGNVVTQDMLAQLRPGMEKSKVRFIMGTPLVVDVFHTDRWDYIYTFAENGDDDRQQRRVSLHFEGDRLARIEGDVRPASGPMVVEAKKGSEVEVTDEAGPGIMTRLRETMGLGPDTDEDDEDATEAAAAVDGAGDDARADGAEPLSPEDLAPAADEEDARQAALEAIAREEAARAAAAAAEPATAEAPEESEESERDLIAEDPALGTAGEEDATDLADTEEEAEEADDGENFFSRVWKRLGGSKDVGPTDEERADRIQRGGGL